MASKAFVRFPFYYGWVVIAVAFVTMGIGVNARTAFSLLYPSILDEFGWTRATTAGAFSVGFATAALYAPFVGLLMDRIGPRYVIAISGLVVAAGLVLTTHISQPWHLHLTLGVLVVGVSTILSYVGHSMFLPNWFRRRRGLAIGIAFSGVGFGSLILFPWLQQVIASEGWRQACYLLAILVILLIIPANILFQRRRPEDFDLLPDGDSVQQSSLDDNASAGAIEINEEKTCQNWTVGMALKTARFWWLALAFITALFAWYAVQVHQTKYLIEIGFNPALAAWALGFVVAFGVVGQIALGYVSDKLGRELVWTISLIGFATCYVLLILLGQYQSMALLFLMIAVQGLLGYGITAVYGAIPADLFQGQSYGAIFGVLSLASSLGAAMGPWTLGWIHDQTGTYVVGFSLAIALCAVSIISIWIAAPRRTRIRNP